MGKSRNRLKYYKNHSETSFFETQKASQKGLFVKLQKTGFDSVFAGKNSLFYYGFYSVLNDDDFF